VKSEKKEKRENKIDTHTEILFDFWSLALRLKKKGIHPKRLRIKGELFFVK
jgi:hypothetical protein